MKQSLPIFSAVLIISFLVISFVVFGQQNSQNNTRPFSELTFVVTPERDTFLPMEPIVLNLSLSNNTNSPILGHTNIDFNSAFVDLYVSNQQGDRIKIGSLRTVMKDRTPIEDNPIPPNYRVEVTDVFYTLHRYFPEAGTYKFEAVLRGTKSGQEVKAAPFTISIIEPTGRDRAAYNFLKTKNVKPFFLYGVESADTEMFKHYENIANQFGDTDYGDYATWVVANTSRFRGDKMKAKQMLKRLQSRPNFVFKEKVKELLEELEEEENQP
ncbi:MAG TPA: hypothetical protein VGB02_21280 [Pyrinomonadaceae bacterium]|jgi:hypothetical protein